MPWKTGGRDLSRWVKWSLEALRGLWSHRFVSGHDLSSPKTLLLRDPLVAPTKHTGRCESGELPVGWERMAV